MEINQFTINRTAVPQNSKCESCVHYDGNVAKSGACDVGTQPSMCGSGLEPKYGYAALADLSVDEIDDLATPQLSGAVGAMNEHGLIEPMVLMKRVSLGDDDLTFAQRIYGEMTGVVNKSLSQGEVNRSMLGFIQDEQPKNVMVNVAKALHDTYLAPRKQVKYGVTDVLMFLKESGMPVMEADIDLAKSRFGPTRQIQVPTMAEAHAHIAAHNAATRAPGGMGHQTASAPVAAKPALRAPRNKTPTMQMPLVKAEMVKPVKLSSEQRSKAAALFGAKPATKHDNWATRPVPNVVKAIGGEGSHGGHIIGHTKKGKPIYGPKHGNGDVLKHAALLRTGQGEPYPIKHEKLMDAAKRHVAEHHQGFTKDEHLQAAHLHDWEAGDAKERANSIHTTSLDREKHVAEQDANVVLKRAHQEAAQSKSKKKA